MEAGDGVDAQGVGSDCGACQECGVVGDEDPGGAEFADGFVGGGVDDAGLHVGGGGQEGDLGGEV